MHIFILYTFISVWHMHWEYQYCANTYYTFNTHTETILSGVPLVQYHISIMGLHLLLLYTLHPYTGSRWSGVLQREATFQTASWWRSVWWGVEGGCSGSVQQERIYNSSCKNGERWCIIYIYWFINIHFRFDIVKDVSRIYARSMFRVNIRKAEYIKINLRPNK